ncbi:MAG: hypothetical protein RIS70_1029 [Planctomycetota bacterium]
MNLPVRTLRIRTLRIKTLPIGTLKISTFGAAMFAFLAGFATAASAQDRVYNLKNVPVQGTVTETTPDKVTVETPQGARTFEVNEISRITFGEDPPAMAKVRENLRDGNYESALTDVKSIDANAVSRDIIKQEIQYFKAFCEGKIALASGGKREDAITNLQGFFRGNPMSYHFYEGAELLGDLSMANGDFTGAGRFYAALAKAAWPEFKLKSAVLEAQTLVGQKKYPEAIEKFESVIGSSESSAEANRFKLLAQVGKGNSLANTGKTEEATKMLEEIIRNNDSKDTRLFGRAYNALGSCYLKSNRPKEALLQYLHVHLMFYGEPEAHAEALHHLVKLWTDLQKSDRAIEARTLLQQQYGGSVWAKGI